MLSKIKLIPLIACVALGLQACGDDDKRTAGAPTQLANINTAVYSALRQNPLANQIFVSSGSANIGDEPCEVKFHRMEYNTVGGMGEAATSSGVFMLPHGDDPRCQGPHPVLLYAHGTRDEKDYDMSQFLTNPTNQGTFDSTLLLANYASQGYAVIAPNFAGYADSSLSYHPYLDETQQAAEMMDALDHVREYAGILGADLSSQLFVSGASAGANSAMATHKALEASGETVTAAAYNSGPYAMLDFIDAIMAGYVSLGTTTFVPMAVTSLDNAYDIYDDPTEIYAPAYAGIAENILPGIGGKEATTLPETALFSGSPPEDANPFHMLGFGDDHLLADSFRAAYLADLQANPTEPVYKARKVFKELDLRDWTPNAPLIMCGADTDATVYHRNSDLMAEYWSDLVAVGLVTNLDLNDTPAGPFAPVMTAFQNAGLEVQDVHGGTEVYCAPVGANYFNAIRAQAAAQ